ncbi:MAG: alpha/beta hydrolase [Sphingorhabdus sp.]|jgi:pimeloyl-ACP methyl ester carboxylesterase|uniref:alpha/beta fold hydrolase n=4 Tax=Sphingorhabdus sp. TaxID=1902408 RepID=UPI00273FE2E1|nr:alpha/beta hydrolase [Sphingorhabdus sp.]MDP4757946.1 alpha/beta hydrolase [Sphingorhabdus sp.]MDP4872058.1 alpha/beta hydrolase [Sphingorhabdus sp.]MDP4927118.1 alpha/beta hydrolase [Sphingorhabdus sp.]
MIELFPHRLSLSTGIDMDVFTAGNPAHPAIIFLHGFPESHRTWRHQMAHFADRFYCIAPDQRGYRGTSKPKEVEAYTADKLTADIFALADALNVQQFVIAGHDWGGAIAWSVALNGQPDAPNPAWAGRVRRAVIANAPHPYLFQRLLITDMNQRASSQYMIDFRDTANDALVQDQGLTGLMLKTVKWDKPSAMEPEERTALLADWADRDACFGMLNWYRASALYVPTMDEDAEIPAFAAGAFPQLMIPTLVVWAMEDLALPPTNIDGIEELVPDVTIAPVENCGHFVIWERPDAVNAAMEQFLR